MSENREKEYFYLVYPRRIPDAQLDKVMQTTKILDSYTGQLQDRETEVYKIKEPYVLDMIDFAFNKFLPNEEYTPKPIRISSATADAYGLERLVMNIQKRLGSLPYALWVAKIPSVYMAELYKEESLDENFGEKAEDSTFCPLLPLNNVAKVGDKVMQGLASNFIDRVYLNYPDLRCVKNESCMPLSPIHKGLILSPEQRFVTDIYHYSIWRINARNDDVIEKLEREYDYDCAKLHKDRLNELLIYNRITYLDKQGFKKYNEKYLKPQLLEYRNKMSRFKIMALLENSSIVEDARRRQTMLEKGEF